MHRYSPTQSQNSKYYCYYHIVVIFLDFNIGIMCEIQVKIITKLLQYLCQWDLIDIRSKYFVLALFYDEEITHGVTFRRPKFDFPLMREPQSCSDRTYNTFAHVYKRQLHGRLACRTRVYSAVVSVSGVVSGWQHAIISAANWNRLCARPRAPCRLQ